jgi:hypothetical protein
VILQGKGIAFSLTVKDPDSPVSARLRLELDPGDFSWLDSSGKSRWHHERPFVLQTARGVVNFIQPSGVILEGASMIDINLVREHSELVRKAMQARQLDPAPVDQVLEQDERRRALIQEVETLKAERNTVSKEIGHLKDPVERQNKIDAMRQVGERITGLDEALRCVDILLDEAMAVIPNIPDPRTPLGKDEHDNVVLKTVGELPNFVFEPKAHWDLGPALGIINFEQGVKITGSRFYVLSGAGARLQRALIAWMLDLHIRQGYTEKYTPFKGIPCLLQDNFQNLRIICTVTTRKICGWCQLLRYHLLACTWAISLRSLTCHYIMQLILPVFGEKR